MRLAVVFLLLMVASAAVAQSGRASIAPRPTTPSIAQSATTRSWPRPIGRWRRRTRALVGKLRGAAKDEAIKDQVRWIGDRNRACLSVNDGTARCLRDRYARRTSNLRAFADGTYPFIGEHALIKRGQLGKIDWSYDIVYPQFDGPTSDFAAINARFADAAKKKAEDATPGTDARPDLKQQWTYGQSFTVKRPSADVVSIACPVLGL